MMKKKKKKEDKQFGTLADFQFGTSSILASNFEGLVGYRTLCHEGQVPLKAYDCVLAEICIATYGMFVPSLHKESTVSATSAN